MRWCYPPPTTICCNQIQNYAGIESLYVFLNYSSSRFLSEYNKYEVFCHSRGITHFLSPSPLGKRRIAAVVIEMKAGRYQSGR